MNFLAHHIISIYPENYFYNLGLTFPDILSLQNNKSKVNSKFVDEKLIFLKSDYNFYSFFCGMKVHLQLDKWFHNSSYFFNLMRKTSEIVQKNNFPIHQFIEILFDIFIDGKDKNFAISLINTYKDKRLEELVIRIKDFYKIDEVVFPKLISYISNGIFYSTYLNDDNLLNLLKKLENKIYKKEILLDENSIKKLINTTKISLKSEFEDLFDTLLVFSKDIQSKLDFK